MSKLRVGIIGTGDASKPASSLGYAMAYRHADGYEELDSCEVVACADIVQKNADAFADKYAVPKTYLDYKVMLAEESLDIVSVCTWMHLHEEMVLETCKAGVKAIHCEKPMADTWGGSKRMAAAAKDADVQLTFNHQRRYGEPFVMAKQMLDDGKIGELQRLECGAGNMYDTGTHFIDMLSFFLGDGVPAKWVLAQIDYRTENLVFGSHNENQQVALVEYENGVFGVIMTGTERGSGPVGCMDKLIGTHGVIEVGVDDGPPIRYRLAGETEWTAPDTGEGGVHGPNFIERAMADVVDCLLTGRKCQLNASNALVATEIIFGAYESSRRRARVDFPLDIDDNPLAAMVESGDLNPAKE